MCDHERHLTQPVCDIQVKAPIALEDWVGSTILSNPLFIWRLLLLSIGSVCSVEFMIVSVWCCCCFPPRKTKSQFWLERLLDWFCLINSVPIPHLWASASAIMHWGFAHREAWAHSTYYCCFCVGPLQDLPRRIGTTGCWGNSNSSSSSSSLIDSAILGWSSTRLQTTRLTLSPLPWK